MYTEATMTESKNFQVEAMAVEAEPTRELGLSHQEFYADACIVGRIDGEVIVDIALIAPNGGTFDLIVDPRTRVATGLKRSDGRAVYAPAEAATAILDWMTSAYLSNVDAEGAELRFLAPNSRRLDVVVTDANLAELILSLPDFRDLMVQLPFRLAFIEVGRHPEPSVDADDIHKYFVDFFRPSQTLVRTDPRFRAIALHYAFARAYLASRGEYVEVAV